jgi:hypothetical protein
MDKEKETQIAFRAFQRSRGIDQRCRAANSNDSVNLIETVAGEKGSDSASCLVSEIAIPHNISKWDEPSSNGSPGSTSSNSESRTQYIAAIYIRALRESVAMSMFYIS